MNKDLVCWSEKIKCSNIIKQYKNVSLWLYKKVVIKEHNPKWPEILEHPYRI